MSEEGQIPRLTVKVSGTSVGYLESLATDRVVFVLSESWLEDDQHPPLGLSFLTDPSPREGKGGLLPVWFENLLPERRSPLRRWLARQNELSPHDSLALIARLGRDLPGAVEVVGAVDNQMQRTPDTVDVPESVTPRFSLTGVQFKLSMAREGTRFVLPARNESGYWIVKIPDSAHPEIAEVEAATMAWAEKVDLPIPVFELVPFEQITGLDAEEFGRPETAYVVARFDRTESGRIHQEDFAQALEFSPENKYAEDQSRGTSYDMLGRLLNDISADCAAEFVRRLAFVVASGNGDAHLKNWSFQWSDHHKPRLSPCYDQVCTVSWEKYGWKPGKREGPELALALGKTRKFGELTHKHIARFARRSGIVDAEKIFFDTLEKACQSWPIVRNTAPGRMREALEHHWEKVPILAAIGPLTPPQAGKA